MVEKANYDIKTIQKFSLEMYKSLKTIHRELWLDVNAFASPRMAFELFEIIDECFLDMEGDNECKYKPQKN